MNDLGVGSKLLQRSCHPIVETHTDGKNDVSMGNRHIGPVRAMHSQHSQRKRMSGGKTSQTHECGRDWDVKRLGKAK